jgi:hypothetical protein
MEEVQIAVRQQVNSAKAEATFALASKCMPMEDDSDRLQRRTFESTRFGMEARAKNTKKDGGVVAFASRKFYASTPVGEAGVIVRQSSENRP